MNGGFDPYNSIPDPYTEMLREMDIACFDAAQKIKEFLQTPYASFVVAVMVTGTGASTTVVIISAGVYTIIVNIVDKDTCDLLVLTIESMASGVGVGKVYSILSKRFGWTFMREVWAANLGPNAIGAAIDYAFGDMWAKWRNNIEKVIDEFNKIKDVGEAQDSGDIYDGRGIIVPDFASSQTKLSIFNVVEFQKGLQGKLTSMNSEEQREVLLAIMSDMSDQEIENLFKPIEKILSKSEKRKYERFKKSILQSIQENKKKRVKNPEKIKKMEQWIMRQIIPSGDSSLGENVKIVNLKEKSNDKFIEEYNEKYKSLFEELSEKANDIYGQSDENIFEKWKSDFDEDQEHQSETMEFGYSEDVDEGLPDFHFAKQRQLSCRGNFYGKNGKKTRIRNKKGQLQQQEEKFIFWEERFYENYNEKFKKLSEDLTILAYGMYKQSDSLMLQIRRNLLEVFSNKGSDDKGVSTAIPLQPNNTMPNLDFASQERCKDKVNNRALPNQNMAGSATVTIVNNLGITLSPVSKARWNGRQYVVDVELVGQG